MAYFIFLLVSADPDSKLIELEMFCWVSGLVSSIILLSAITYTIIKLNKLWTGTNQEGIRITVIAVVFGLAFITKSIYEWSEYAIQ